MLKTITLFAQPLQILAKLDMLGKILIQTDKRIFGEPRPDHSQRISRARRMILSVITAQTQTLSDDRME